MLNQYVVLVDPANNFWRGSIVGDQYKRVIESQKGHSVLPIDHTLTRKHALAGFMERHWGSGYELHDFCPGRACPMALFICGFTNSKRLHWAARVVPDGKSDVLDGQLRLVTDSSSVQTSVSAGISTDAKNFVDLSQLGDMDEAGGWNVGGSAQISVAGDGMLSLSLWGMSRGLKVVWSAVSQAE